MTAWFAWLLLPKPPLLDGAEHFCPQSVRNSNGKLLRVTLSADQKSRIWTPLERISPDLINATLRYEDKYYAHHPGGESDRACPRRGGPPAFSSSDYRRIDHHDATGPPLRFTFTPERFPENSSKIMRALKELERHYSKNQILEAYLNLAPYGATSKALAPPARFLSISLRQN